jgi:hypothetical protein
MASTIESVYNMDNCMARLSQAKLMKFIWFAIGDMDDQLGLLLDIPSDWK